MTNKRIILGALIAACFVAALTIAVFAPAEQTLGNAAKVVYVHAGLIFVSMCLVTVVGIMGLLYLITGRDIFYKWAKPTKRVTLIFWGIYLISGIAAMWLAWGGMIWQEPRMLLGFSIFILLIAIYILATTVHAPKLVSLFNVIMGASVWLLLSQVPAILHPTTRPINNSSSLWIKLSTLAILVLFAVAAALSVVLSKDFEQKT